MTPDGIDRALRRLTKSSETRDILRALLRHRESGHAFVEASDGDVERWTGIDAANVGRRVREDEAFKGPRVTIRRGRPPAFGAPAAPTRYGLAGLIGFVEAEEEWDRMPPSVDLVAMELQERGFKLGHRYQEVAEQALAATAAHHRQPLVRGDLNEVIKHAVKLAATPVPQAA